MIKQFKLEPNQLARRLDGDEVMGVFTKGVIADPYLRVLHLKDGALMDVHLGGRIDMGSLWDRLQSLAFTDKHAVIIVNSGDFLLQWQFYKVMLQDRLAVDVTLEIRAHISEPALFFANLMQSRRTVELQELKGRYYNELFNLINTQLAPLSFEDLAASREGKNQLQVALERHLHTTFSRDGILLIQISAVRMGNKELAEIQEGEADLHLAARRNRLMNDQQRLHYEQQLARAEMSFRYDRQSGELKLQAQATQLEQYQRRSRLWQQMREALRQKKMDEVSSAKALEDFLREQDRDKLLKESDYTKLKQDLAWAAQDRELARRHLLARMEAEQAHELRILKLLQSQEVDERSLVYKMAQERRMLEEQLAVMRAQNEARREEEKLTNLHQRRQEREEHLHRLEMEKEKKMAQRAQMVADARVRKELEQIEMQITTGWMEIKRIKEEEALSRELRREKEKQALVLAAEEKRLRLRTQEEWRRHKMQLEKERLQLQARETELRYDLEKERVRAEVTKVNSQYQREAEVAAARLEEMRQHSEVMREQHEKGNERYDRMVREQQGSQKEVLEKALDKIGDVAMAYASAMQPQAPPPPAAVPPPAISPPSPTVAEKVCTNCMSPNPLNARFCFNCGHPFA